MADEVQCWHTEPDSPCDWDVCRQTERLATGDIGTDPMGTASHATPEPCEAAITSPVLAVLSLFSADLLSKWGCNDGSDPDEWLDWCEAQGIEHNALTFPWAAVVRTHLVPVIEQAVTVVDIETSHNPIRVETVNGVDTRDAWYGRAAAPPLTPELVDVPMDAILQLALAEAGLTAPPRSRGATL